MSHDLATTNGKTAMFYHGDTPWHGQGQEMDHAVTANEAIVAAGLDYEVELASLQTTDGIPVSHKAVVRSDTQDVLGVVGKDYRPVQNRESFAFLDAIVAEGGLRYHTAGALGRGERVWLLAKLPGHIRVKSSDDVTEKYLLLSNSHNGSSSLRVHYTAIRVVCANTMAAALRAARGQGVAIIHKGDLAGKVREAQQVLGMAHQYFDDLEGHINSLANHYPTSDQLTTYFRGLYPDPEGRESSRAKKVRDQLHRLFENGIGQDIPEIRGTTWAALNAVTEYVDHHRGSRGRNPLDRANRRLESAWFGSGARLKDRAFSSALQMAEG